MNIRISILPGSLVEGSPTFTLHLFNPALVCLGAPLDVICTILDNQSSRQQVYLPSR